MESHKRLSLRLWNLHLMAYSLAMKILHPIISYGSEPIDIRNNLTSADRFDNDILIGHSGA